MLQIISDIRGGFVAYSSVFSGLVVTCFLLMHLYLEKKWSYYRKPIIVFLVFTITLGFVPPLNRILSEVNGLQYQSSHFFMMIPTGVIISYWYALNAYKTSAKKRIAIGITLVVLIFVEASVPLQLTLDDISVKEIGKVKVSNTYGDIAKEVLDGSVIAPKKFLLPIKTYNPSQDIPLELDDASYTVGNVFINAYNYNINYVVITRYDQNGNDAREYIDTVALAYSYRYKTEEGDYYIYERKEND